MRSAFNKLGRFMLLQPMRRLSALSLAALIVLAGPATANPETAPATTWRWQDVSRIVVIPDVHGAYEAMVELLKATEMIDGSLSWVGGTAHLVSLGDLLDRGSGSRAAMDLLMRLQPEAAAAGGHVHVLLGNHEHMNLIGDLRYVAADEYAAFAAEEPAGARDTARAEFAAAHPELGPDQLAEAFAQTYPPGFFGHRAAFRPDGRYGRWLLGLPTLIVINDTAFVHGGLPEFTSTLSPAQLNSRFTNDLAQYLDVWRKLVAAGVVPDDEATKAAALINEGLLADPSRCIQQRVLECEAIESNGELAAWVDEFTRLSKALVNSTNSPFWYRGSVYCRDILERPVLDAYLDRLRVRRVVVGHTPTVDARVRTIRDGKIIMADTGMLVSYYKGRPAALLMEDGEMLVQYLDPAERMPPVEGPGLIAYGLDEAGLKLALREGLVSQVARGETGAPWQVTLEYQQQPVSARFYPAESGGAQQRELAAYLLDKLLGLELVAPTVARPVEGVPGTLQLVYPGEISEQQRREQGLGVSGWCSATTQFQLMYTFDLLIANAGRNLANVLFRRDNWTLQLTGHNEAFGTRRKLPDGLADDAISLPVGVAAALAGLNEAALRAELGELLSKAQIRAIVARRDALLQKFVTP